MNLNETHLGDCRDVMRQAIAANIRAQCIVTSPPYFGLRDYGMDGQIGLEQSPDDYVAAMVDVFAVARDLLADDGTLWLNVGDSYAANRGVQPAPTNTRNKSGHVAGANVPLGLKSKDLIGIPWLLAFALRADGWYLRQDIIWHKPNPMPESVKDRCTKSHEYVFLMSKSDRYYFDSDSMKEPAVWAPSKQSKEIERAPGYYGGKGTDATRNDKSFKAIREMRNRRSVWTVATKPYRGAHFATFPPALIEPCIRAGSRLGDVVLDPFMGSGTTAVVSERLGRRWLGAELNPDYIRLQRERMKQASIFSVAA